MKEYSNYFGKGKKITVHLKFLNTKWEKIITSYMYSFVTDACLWHHMKSNMNEQWDLGGHKIIGLKNKQSI